MTDQRGDVRIPVDFFVNKIIDGVPYTCRATNISRGGLLLVRINEPWVGSPVVGLQFQIPNDADVILCAGEVMHEAIRTDATGVRFTVLDPAHHERIHNYIARQLDQLRRGAVG